MNGYINEIYKFLINKGVSVYFIEFPTVNDLQNPTKLEKLHRYLNLDKVYNKYYPKENYTLFFNHFKKKDLFNIISNNKELYKNVDFDVDAFFSDIDIVSNGKYFLCEDCESKSFNVKNGIRKTMFNDNQYFKNIFMFGNSTMFGYYVNDEHTISSYLQFIAGCNVFNMATVGDDIENIYKRILNTRINQHDIVVVGIPYGFADNIESFPYINIIKFFDLYNEKENFIDKAHYTSYCHKWVADKIFNIIKKDISNFTEYDISHEIDEFCNSFNNLEFEDGMEIGATVASCNPFTIGHKFLIETGSRLFDKFFVFLMQEGIDLIFEQNICSDLVKIGVKEFDNVVVVDLPKLFSYERYWNEYSNNDLRRSKEFYGIDTRRLLYIVAKSFNRCNIKHFLCGIETDDNITKQHIQQAKYIFEQNNINFISIPRKNMKNIIRISGTECRNLLKEKRYDELRNFIPSNVVEYIKENRFKVNIVKKQYSDKICNFVDSQNEKLLFNDDILTVDDDYTIIVNDFILFLESISKYNKENLLNLLEKKNEVSVLAGYELLKRKEIDKKYYIDVYSRLKNSDMKKELQLIYEK